MIIPCTPTKGNDQAGLTSLKVTLTVRSSSASTFSTDLYEPVLDEPTSLFTMYRYVKRTSFAVNGTPSDHLMPGLSFHVTDLPSGATWPFSRDGISAARKGTSWPSASKLASGS